MSNYHRFSLSFHDIADLLAERGMVPNSVLDDF